MSSMRNAVQRRVHRERAQPHERARFGLLEKHKDYSLRATDHKRKKATLRNLRAKAATRNDDEFYFGMLSRRGPGSAITAGGNPSANTNSSGKRSWSGRVGTRDGERGDGVRALSVAAVRLMKTQDIKYVRTMRSVAVKELARLEERAKLREHQRGNKVVFCEDGEEREEALRRGVEEAANADMGEHEEDADGPDTMEKLRKKLEYTRRKVRMLTEAEQELDEQRVKMAKTATSGGHTKRGERIVVHKRKR